MQELVDGLGRLQATFLEGSPDGVDALLRSCNIRLDVCVVGRWFGSLWLRGTARLWKRGIVTSLARG